MRSNPHEDLWLVGVFLVIVIGVSLMGFATALTWVE